MYFYLNEKSRINRIMESDPVIRVIWSSPKSSKRLNIKHDLNNIKMYIGLEQ